MRCWSSTCTGRWSDPIAVSAELGQLLGERDGLEAARLWRLEYSFRLTAMGQYEDFRGDDQQLPG